MVGVTFCVVEFSYFGLCKVLCSENLHIVRSTWETSQIEDKFGARDKILTTKVAHRACSGQTFPHGWQMTIMQAMCKCELFQIGEWGNVCPARARRAPGALLLY